MNCPRSFALPLALLALAGAPARAQVDRLWIDDYEPPGLRRAVPVDLALAQDGGAFVAGVEHESDLPQHPVQPFVRRLAADGTPLWTTLLAPPGAFQVASHACALADGGAAVAGRDLPPFHFETEWLVWRLDAAGAVLWRTVIPTSLSSFGPAAIAAAPDGDLLVAGTGQIATSASWGRLVRLQPNGAVRWTLNIGSPVLGGSCRLSDLVVGAGGEAFVTGHLYETTVGPQLLVGRVSPTGQLVWQQLVGGSGYETGWSIALDPAGGPVAVGVSEAAGYRDGLAAAWTAGGAPRWSTRIPGPGATLLTARHVEVDAAGRSVLASAVESSTGGTRGFALHLLDPQGRTLKESLHFDGQPFLLDLDLGPGGRAAVAGSAYQGTLPPSRGTLWGFDPEGNLAWTRTQPGPSGGSTTFVAVGATSDGRVLTTTRDCCDVGDTVTLAWRDRRVDAYCASQTTSVGSTPTLTASGEASASGATPFDVQATGLVSGQLAAFFYGTSGEQALPFGGGTLCVAPSLVRTPPQATGGPTIPPDGSGTASLDMAAWIASGADPSLTLGAQVWLQCWSRDPGASSGTNLSHGLTFGIGP